MVVAGVAVAASHELMFGIAIDNNCYLLILC